MKKTLKILEKIFILFIIGSVLGFLFETIVVLFQKGHFEWRKGVIYGPFIPVYGIGTIIYYIFFEKVKIRKIPEVFLVCMVLGGITEYICSYVQEAWFGTISWDYSYLPFNLNGRTSLLHCTYWGIAGILYLKLVLPYIEKIDIYLENNIVQNLIIIFAIFMTFNVIVSIMAANRQEDRQKNIPARNSIDVFLDKTYPDERMDKIFSNKKYVK